ncbi:hypothetical protein [Pedobacter panaciterrae]|uniref:hypothetical protein n=1 Tax=Pedobacter panaciterrae TaxID=363849 RepID=UPI00155D8B0E|nr:hypothetical protein [Pedobacter panaciterrae]
MEHSVPDAYGFVLHWQTANFGRIYAAYGGLLAYRRYLDVKKMRNYVNLYLHNYIGLFNHEK